jgi:GNAT superfamily N-acetyltransferase
MILPLAFLAALTAPLLTEREWSVKKTSPLKVNVRGGYGNANSILDSLVSGMMDYAGWDFWGLERYSDVDADWNEGMAAWEKAIDRTLEGIGLYPDDFVFELASIEVSPRESGIGKALVSLIEERVRSRGAKAMLLQSGQLHDRHSLPFWKKMGFVEVPGNYGSFEDRLMFKRLS